MEHLRNSSRDYYIRDIIIFGTICITGPRFCNLTQKQYSLTLYFLIDLGSQIILLGARFGPQAACCRPLFYMIQKAHSYKSSVIPITVLHWSPGVFLCMGLIVFSDWLKQSNIIAHARFCTQNTFAQHKWDLICTQKNTTLNKWVIKTPTGMFPLCIPFWFDWNERLRSTSTPIHFLHVSLWGVVQLTE